MTWGVDYPWTHPTAAALQASGAAFAMRYLSTDASKNLTRAEADDLAAHGIWCGVVWETTEGRALAGQAAGAADARTAAAQAAACGMPPDRPIYFAVDTDTDWPSVRPYFTGAAGVLGAARTGVYGGLHVVRGAAASGLVTWYWQTSAWSGGVWDPDAHLRQGGAVTIGGVDCDRNTATTTDYGQWMPDRSPQEDDVPYTEDQLRAMIREETVNAVSSQPVRDSIAYAVHYADDNPDGIRTLVRGLPQQVWQHGLPNVTADWQQRTGADAVVPAMWLLAANNPIQYQLAVAKAQIAAQAAVMQTLLSHTDGIDTATVTAAIEAAVAKALASGVEMHVTTGPTDPTVSTVSAVPAVPAPTTPTT
ncbi:glycoside hydrolase domain-containing protein [Kitasatospora sp. NPDC059722]|uniref:glycoside hydrolase domain-containing protein n=1 Tax=Kitasatospora sp. NPDC059722 TaxID=3346925 RepID=UPI0036CAFB45